MLSLGGEGARLRASRGLPMGLEPPEPTVKVSLASLALLSLLSNSPFGSGLVGLVVFADLVSLP